MALQFNAKLSPALVALRKKSPGSKIVLVDVYDILHNMIENPKKYGMYIKHCIFSHNLFLLYLFW